MPSKAGHQRVDPDEREEMLPETEDALRELLIEVREQVRKTRDTPEMRRAQRIERRLNDLIELNSPDRHEWHEGLSWWPGNR